MPRLHVGEQHPGLLTSRPPWLFLPGADRAAHTKGSGGLWPGGTLEDNQHCMFQTRKLRPTEVTAPIKGTREERSWDQSQAS